MADQNLIATWIYPVRDGEAKVVELPAGSPAPDGYVFSPADAAAAREVKPAAPARTSRKKARK